MKNLYQHINKGIFSIVILGAALLTTTNAGAQINPLSSQYFTNEYLANPAMAGIRSGLNLNLSYRQQWSGVQGAPSTQAITADYRFTKVGLGINISNDKAGILQRTRAVATYAYHLPAGTDGQQLSFGLSFGMMNQNLNTADINGDAGDQEAARYNERKTYADGDFGAAYTSNNLSVQAAIPNMKSFFKKDDNNVVNRPTFFSSVSYKLQFGQGLNRFGVEPKLCYRGIQGNDNIVDAGANVLFAEDKLYMTAMYHSTKSTSIGFGFNYKSAFTVGGFYTTETAALQQYTKGDFELNLKFRLAK